MSSEQKKLVYTSNQQKKKLLRLIVQHPELVSGKYSKDFTFRDSQNLWCSIAVQCNAIPGAKKTWRQWRKTWHDMKSKTKRRMKNNAPFSYSIGTLSTDERETLGFKNVSSTTSFQNSTENDLSELEIGPVESLQEEDENHVVIYRESEFNEPESLEEPQSPPESKVFVSPIKSKAAKIVSREQESHSDRCAFNCDSLALQEQRKTQIKEDYYEFKKDYLRQKLLLMKEQTEALKDIAKELSK